MNQEQYTAAFNRAVLLAQAGEKQMAYSELIKLAGGEGYTKDANLFLWIAFTTPDLAEARRALEAAGKLEPTNPNLASAQVWLAEEERKRPLSIVTVPVEVVPPAPVYSPKQQDYITAFENVPAIPIQLVDKAIRYHEAMINDFKNLIRQGRVWSIEKEEAYYHSRSKANKTIDRRPVGLFCGPLNGGRHKFDVPTIDTPRLMLYFMPHALMVYTKSWNRVQPVPYQHLHFESEPVIFEETDRVLPGVQIFDHVWAASNVDGSPDRRFNNNYRIPRVRYLDTTWTCEEGILHEHFMVSHADWMFSIMKKVLHLSVIALGQDPEEVLDPSLLESL